MADKFYQQIIEMKNYNICLGSTSKDPPVTVVDKVSQHNRQKMSFHDPAYWIASPIFFTFRVTLVYGRLSKV
jgi:hypothetical protein